MTPPATPSTAPPEAAAILAERILAMAGPANPPGRLVVENRPATIRPGALTLLAGQATARR